MGRRVGRVPARPRLPPRNLRLSTRPEVATPLTSIRRLGEGYWLKQSVMSLPTQVWLRSIRKEAACLPTVLLCCCSFSDLSLSKDTCAEACLQGIAPPVTRACGFMKDSRRGPAWGAYFVP
ncbi:uncharacterized protein LOC104453267 [Eucalyptus grandis]|uniref:uncharacterized protein LOC104453267 n=1 Tax=Eucalyptus grandis TaxID=71139 RepID=UPI00192EDB4D|nr:uncharacterized protein LOC104453267 [Eucalyptus grandis]